MNTFCISILRCGDAGMLWPRPTGLIQLSQDLINFYPQDVQVISSDFATNCV